MTEEQIKHYTQALKDESLPSEENPLNLFAQTSTNLLAKALAKEFNLVTLIRLEMRKRGVNDKGQWVGFQSAKQLPKRS